MAIFAGAALSAFFAPTALVIASVSAFLISEMSDFFVYAPLRKRNVTAAILASGIVGSIVDSAVFLFIAFGSLDFIAGQIVGKVWITILAAAAVYIFTKARK